VSKGAVVAYWSILLKKSEYRVNQIFSALWVRFSDAAWGTSQSTSNSTETVLIGLRGNQRQSKMLLVFRQICNDFRLATFSTESAQR
jgi:hypothetical protein